jgi:shikimate dehydrogenase
MTPTSIIPLAGVVGQPVAHSQSPRLHAHWLRRYGIAGHYVPLDVAQSHLAEVLAALPKAGFVGVNITIPHKESVLKLADVISDRAALIGAANTLIFRPDGKIHADNTDGYGFLTNLHASAPGWQPTSGPAAVLGAGGASRAIVVSLLEAGTPEIRLANRTRARAEALHAEFGGRVVVRDWVQAPAMLQDCATVVNTTALGMTGKPDLKLALDHLPRHAVVNDLVYTPLRTAFLQAAESHGCVTVDGLGMLLYQAVPGFERWFGYRPEVDQATRDLLTGTV